MPTPLTISEPLTQIDTLASQTICVIYFLTVHVSDVNYKMLPVASLIRYEI